MQPKRGLQYRGPKKIGFYIPYGKPGSVTFIRRHASARKGRVRRRMRRYNILEYILGTNNRTDITPCQSCDARDNQTPLNNHLLYNIKEEDVQSITRRTSTLPIAHISLNRANEHEPMCYERSINWSGALLLKTVMERLQHFSALSLSLRSLTYLVSRKSGKLENA